MAVGKRVSWAITFPGCKRVWHKFLTSFLLDLKPILNRKRLTWLFDCDNKRLRLIPLSGVALYRKKYKVVL